jgi:transposase
MRKMILVDHLKKEEIRRRMLESADRQQFQRWQVIWLASKGLSAQCIGDFVGVSDGTVHQWIHHYNHQGPEWIILQGRGGRRHGLLDVEEERLFLEELNEEAQKGKIIVAFDFRERIEKKIGRKVSKDYLYDLLHRHGWRKVAPRPQHPKAKRNEQEEFKKNFQTWWQPPAKPLMRRIPVH